MFLQEWFFLAPGTICLGHGFSTLRASDLQDVVFQPDKAETGDMTYSFTYHFLGDSPLNRLKSLSWWWIPKADQPLSPMDYRYLNTKVFTYPPYTVLNTHIISTALIFAEIVADFFFFPSQREEIDEENENWDRTCLQTRHWVWRTGPRAPLPAIFPPPGPAQWLPFLYHSAS